MDKELLILEYHRVADEGPASLRPWRLTAGEFADQIAHLRSGQVNVVDLETWFRDSSSMPDKCVAITFDDAFLDFATTAAPLLSQAGFTARVYVPTTHAGGRAIWDEGHGTPAHLMSWNEMSSLSRIGFRFAAHGRSHRPLTQLNDAELQDEVAGSKKEIEDRLGFAVSSIAYPYGMHDSRVRTAAKCAGYQLGVTVEEGVFSERTDPFQAPRYEVHGGSPIEAFQNRIDAFLGVNPG